MIVTSAVTPTLDELQQALPSELRWHRVDWQPSPEPLDKIQNILEMQPEKHNHLLQKLSELISNQAAPPLKCHRTRGYDDLRLTNLQQQGIHLHAVQQQRRYDVTHGQDIRKLLTIHPDPINPQTDIHSTANFQICIRGKWSQGMMGATTCTRSPAYTNQMGQPRTRCLSTD
jgi:hypothetical protein